MQRSLSHLMIAFVVFVISLLLFTLFLLNREFNGQEAAFAVYAEQMLRSGLTLFPKDYQGFSANYMATPVWLMFFSGTLLGKINFFAGLLPSAIAGALTVMFTYLIAATQSRDWGIVSVLFLLATSVFFAAARSITPDLYTIALSTILFYCLYSSDYFSRYLRLMFLPVLFFLGFMTSGLFGLVLLSSIAIIYCLIALKFQRLLYIVLLIITVAIIGIILLLYAAYVQNGAPFAREVFHSQIATALIPTHNLVLNKTGLQELVGSGMFILVLAIFVIILRWRELVGWRTGMQISLIRQLLGWAIVSIFLGALYLPLYNLLLYLAPGSALIAAYLFIGNYSGIFTIAVRKIIYYLFCLIPILALIMAVTGLVLSYLKPDIYAAYYTNAIALLVLIFLFEILLIWRSKNNGLKEFYAILFATLSFITFHIAVLEPVLQNCSRTTPFADQLAVLSQKQAKDVVFYQITPGTLDLRLMAILNSPVIPQFITTPQQIFAYNKPAYFIAKSSDFSTLPTTLNSLITVVGKGNLGCNSAVIFTMQQNAPTISGQPVTQISPTVNSSNSTAVTATTPAASTTQSSLTHPSQ